MYINPLKLLLCLTSIPLHCCFAIPEPYNSIVDLPFDDHGYFYNSVALGRILEPKQPKTVIEIGSWLGSSTRFIANALPDNGKIYAVDTWKGSPQEPWHLNDPRISYLYQLFLSNVKHVGLTHKIIPIRMDSLEAAAALNVKADLIYIDASHDTESVIKDILAWYPHLNDNGIMSGDDWSWPSVREAAIHCADILNKTIKSDGNFWYYE